MLGKKDLKAKEKWGRQRLIIDGNVTNGHESQPAEMVKDGVSHATVFRKAK